MYASKLPGAIADSLYLRKIANSASFTLVSSGCRCVVSKANPRPILLQEQMSCSDSKRKPRHVVFDRGATDCEASRMEDAQGRLTGA